MTPRKASLKVAHSSACANATRTALDSLTGCTCKPSYYVSYQDPSGARKKSARVRDRRLADRMLREQQVEIDKGHAGYQERRDIGFADWVEAYEGVLEVRNLKGETRRGYADTLKIAKDALGWIKLRAIGPAELRTFIGKFPDAADATKIRRLKELSACLNAAKDEGYLDTNPVPAFKRSLRLQAPRTSSPPFTDAEIPKLWLQLGKEKIEPVYLAICHAAVVTGARLGELIALDWDALDLTAGTVEIRATYNPADGVILPKDRDKRTVYLTPDAIQFFEGWIEKEGVRAGIVFRAPRSDQRINDDWLRKVIHKAIVDSGVALVDEAGNKRKPFHSFRATYTRRMLEQGRHPQWVEANLGHSDLRLTMHVYGSWTDEAKRAEAARPDSLLR